MEEALKQDLLAKTKQALAAEDWNALERIWLPWVAQGDPEAEYQLASHYLWFTPCEDDATGDRMKELVRQAAAKDHPDAVCLTASWMVDAETSPEYERLLLKAGQLGSVEAQRSLGVAYATGRWTGPTDLAEAARWYRLAAGQGHALSQYDLGFMILLGQGEPKNIGEGLKWLELAAEQGESCAFGLLADCYENGFCDVPIDAARAASWRERLEEYQRLNPPPAMLQYSIAGVQSESAFDFLLDIDGVVGLSYSTTADGNVTEAHVFCDPAVVEPNAVDEHIRAAGIAAVRRA